MIYFIQFLGMGALTSALKHAQILFYIFFFINFPCTFYYFSPDLAKFGQRERPKVATVARGRNGQHAAISHSHP